MDGRRLLGNQRQAAYTWALALGRCLEEDCCCSMKGKYIFVVGGSVGATPPSGAKRIGQLERRVNTPEGNLGFYLQNRARVTCRRFVSVLSCCRDSLSRTTVR